jgi:hypothetical protein
MDCLILCVDLPVICCSIYAMIRLILMILYLTSCTSALERLIKSKDHYHFRYRIHFMIISARPFPFISSQS